MSAPAAPAASKLRPLPRPVLVPRLRLTPDQEALLDWQASPDGLLGQLCERGLVTEAARLLAYALPEREAVWWGCMCVAHTAARSATAERQALDAAEAWVWRPDAGAAKQAAWAAAAAGYHLPGAWPALAAYWSQQLGGPAGRGGRGIDAATTLAARRGGDEAEVLRRFIASGRDIAAGGPGRLPPPANPAETPS